MIRRIIAIIVLVCSIPFISWCTILDNGESLYRAGQYKKAMEQFALLPAEEPIGSFFRAWMYLKNEGTERNHTKALELLGIAADAGYQPAHYLLGIQYLYGHGVEKNRSTALSHLLAAAEDDYRAVVLLQLIEKKSRGEKRDLAAVVTAVKKAAHNKKPAAQYTLALMHLLGDGVQKSVKEEVYWYQTAAERHPRAAFMLSLLQYNGEGVEKNLPGAFRYMSMAAFQGDPKAAYYLATFYYHGSGITLNRQLAAFWFKKAAEAGIADAQLAFGLLLLSGDGVMVDKASAIEWIGKAARQDNTKAREVLNELLTYRGNLIQNGMNSISQTIPEITRKTSVNDSVRIEEKGLLLDQGTFGLKFSLPTMNDAYIPRTEAKSGLSHILERLQGGTLDIIIRPQQ